MGIKANTKVYLVLTCVLAVVIPLITWVFSGDWITIWGLVLPGLMLGIVWQTLRPPSIIAARVIDDFVEFKVLSWSGVRMSEKYPVEEVKCVCELHSFTKGGYKNLSL